MSLFLKEPQVLLELLYGPISILGFFGKIFIFYFLPPWGPPTKKKIHSTYFLWDPISILSIFGKNNFFDFLPPWGSPPEKIHSKYFLWGPISILSIFGKNIFFWFFTPMGVTPPPWGSPPKKIVENFWAAKKSFPILCFNAATKKRLSKAAKS